MYERGEILSRVGVVAIGRNEGERLMKCLEPLVGFSEQIACIDTGSPDASVEMARATDPRARSLALSRTSLSRNGTRQLIHRVRQHKT